MKASKGFTLVELLVVLAVIVVLVTILVPSISKAAAVARSTLCQGNLQRLGTVLGFVNQVGANASATMTPGRAVTVYPDWHGWPYQAQGACSDSRLFKCIEDARGAVDMAQVRRRVEYRSTYGGGIVIPLAGEVENNYVLSRRGPDYTEYVFEEAGNINQGFWVVGSHNDGWLKLYDNGLLKVVSCNCGGDNQLWIDGKPAFGPNPNDHNSTQMRPNVGKTLRTNLRDSSITSYGVNTYAHRYPYGSNVLVLMDLDDLSASPNDPSRTRAALSASRRHLGRLNTLMADGTVHTKGLSQLDPLLNRSLWDPSRLPVDPADEE
jgi:prepilin-type N-terminal cleavage/methylation domain-containing protein/prepilin-type processing-associated H-X9-DG protein